ncbi:MAG: hypothetical protein ABIT71_12590 [Vicinamibacteraceae bacterium]
MTADVAAPAYAPMPATGRSRRALASVGGVVRRVLRFRPRCLLLGHDDSFVREPRRLMLRCAACGRETPGWTLGPGAPVVTAPRRVSPSRTASALQATARVGPWSVGRRQGRAEAADRQRLRLVAAAARAAERPDESGVRGGTA